MLKKGMQHRWFYTFQSACKLETPKGASGDSLGLITINQLLATLDTLRHAMVCAKHLYIKLYIDLSPHNSTNTAYMSFLLHQAALEQWKNCLEKVLRLAKLFELELEDENHQVVGHANRINLSTLSDAECMEQFWCGFFVCQCSFHAA